MSTESFSKAKYILKFVDDYSKYVWTYFLRFKSDALTHFKNFHKLQSNTYGNIKTLRTDNGGEFTSTAFATYCKENGIKRELSVADTPQQNGVAERYNRILLDRARTL